MNKNDFLILDYLIKEKYFSNFKSITALGISQEEEVGLCVSKVRQVLNDFTSKGLTAEGYKVGNARTFYVTDAGIKMHKQIENS